MVKILNLFKPDVKSEEGKPKDKDGYYIDGSEIKKEHIVGLGEMQAFYFGTQMNRVTGVNFYTTISK